MGSNMARRLKDQGFAVTAVYDQNTAVAKALAEELGCTAPATLPEVTSAADVIITVVSDDEAMDDIFGSVGCGCDSLLGTASGVTVAEGKLFINCATVSPGTHVLVESRAVEAAAQIAGGLHGLEHHPGPRGHALSHVRRQAGDLRCARNPCWKSSAVSLRYIGPTGSAAKVKALVNMVMNINTARPRRRARPGGCARPRSHHDPRSLQPDRRRLARAGHGWGGHAEPRP